MKNIIFLLVILIFASCKKENVGPKSIWDKEFGPYNVISSQTLTVNDNITVPKRQQVVALSYTATSDITIHAKADFYLVADGGFSYWLAVDGKTIATNGQIGGGFTGSRILEVDGIDLKAGQSIECRVGYSEGTLTVNSGSSLLVESY